MNRPWIFVLAAIVLLLLCVFQLDRRLDHTEHNLRQSELINVEQSRVIVGLADDVQQMCRVMVADGRCVMKEGE